MVVKTTSIKVFCVSKLSSSKLAFVPLTTHELYSEHFHNTVFLPLQLPVRKVLLMECSLEGGRWLGHNLYDHVQELLSIDPLPHKHTYICPFLWTHNWNSTSTMNLVYNFLHMDSVAGPAEAFYCVRWDFFFFFCGLYDLGAAFTW